MTDRDRAWKKLASRLHLSLRRCQQETDYWDFLGWMQFFQEEDAQTIERTEKWEHYAARLIATILRANGAKDVSEKDMLIKFKVERPKGKEVSVTKEQRVKESKAFWDAFFAVQKGVQQQVKKPMKKDKR
jgi:hypothetical protein